MYIYVCILYICTFNLRPVSRGAGLSSHNFLLKNDVKSFSTNAPIIKKRFI